VTAVYKISISAATLADAPLILALQKSVAENLTQRHGQGHWSSCPSEKGVLRTLNTSRVLVAKRGCDIIGTVRLESKKPWAIDTTPFSKVRKAVYIHGVAVAPEEQRQGIGRRLVDGAKAVAQAWPSDAIRLDAYDHAAGAAPFYAKCGFREVGRVTYRGIPLIYFELLL
jgi:ribosomal protein S18 acetylase RimI-like enzyme